MYGSGIKILFLILFMAFIALVLFDKLKLGQERRISDPILLLGVIGMAVTVYIREFVHSGSIPWPSDEANYVGILTDYINGGVVTVSGPGYLYAVFGLERIIGLGPANTIVFSAALTSSLFLIIIYLIYKRTSLTSEKALFACLLIASTSYLLWPMLEGRPQQLGMLFVLASLVLFHKYLKNWKFAFPFAAVFMFTFLFHILSFLVISGAVFLYWWYWYAGKRIGIKQVILPAGLFALGLIMFFRGWFLYGSTTGVVDWMLRDSSIPMLGKGIYLIPIGIMGLAALAVITFFVRKKDILKRLFFLLKKYSKFVFPVLCVGAVGAILVQYFLVRDVYSAKYFGNPLYFVLMQVGNIFFGVVFIYGAYGIVKEDGYTDMFFTYSFILMGMGALLVSASIFLPEGANNWMVRILNYWTLFAAPVGLAGLMRLKGRSRDMLIILIPLLITVSLLNISRDALLFGYP